jgi:hypothetical protein
MSKNLNEYLENTYNVMHQIQDTENNQKLIELL